MFRRFSSSSSTTTTFTAASASKSFFNRPLSKRFLFITAATGTTAATASLILPVLYFPDDSLLKRTNTKILSHLYKNYFPVNLLTKQSEWLSRKEIPPKYRSTIFQYYSALTGANLQEAEKPLQEYKTLDEFFTRKLKTGIRKIDSEDDINVLVSPVDGKVISYGKLSSSSSSSSGSGSSDDDDAYIDEVKGYKYKLQDFLRTNCNNSSSTSRYYYYIHLYLDPGDYHRFHSPTDLQQVTNIEHVQGELYTVNPTMTSLLLPNIFTLNERVVITSQLQSNTSTNTTCTKLYYVPVGATNVSSIELTFDPSKEIRKGEEIGMFHLGSTVVMVLEFQQTGKEEFEFDEVNLRVGEKIQLGKSIGRIISND